MASTLKAKAKKGGKAQPVRIPLAFEEAITALLGTPPPPKQEKDGAGTPKRPRRKKKG